jgi:acetyltransferase EpsM
MIGESGYEFPSSAAIFGSGWHGRTVLANFHVVGADWRCVFLDDTYWGREVEGRPVIGPRSMLDDKEFVASREFIVGIGDTNARREIAQLIEAKGGKFFTSIHPSAVLCHNIEIGLGTAIMPCAVIGTGCHVGKHCVINNGVTLGHDTSVMDCASVSDGAHTGGSVAIEEESFIGMGVTIRPGVRIGARAIVGMGAVVLNDVPPDVTVVGCPAKIIRHVGTRG